MPICKLKATEEDKSRAIILSFNSKWHELIRAGKVGVVFRKTGPRRFTPDCIYAYLSQPISAIVARIPVLRYEEVPIEQAVKLAKKGSISQDELLAYADRRPTLMVYTVALPIMATTPLTRQALATQYDFAPSQTFIPLSATGVRLLDNLAGFA